MMALIPLLLATGPGSEIQSPLVMVVIGGLFSSTALILVVDALAWWGHDLAYWLVSH
jgi:Cu/Ag efflux pump CusA